MISLTIFKSLTYFYCNEKNEKLRDKLINKYKINYTNVIKLQYIKGVIILVS